jgi:hypothetical protein
MANEQLWKIDPTKLPQKLELEIPAETMEWLKTTAQESGRSEDELILEILDQALQSREQSENTPEDHSA